MDFITNEWLKVKYKMATSNTDTGSFIAYLSGKRLWFFCSPTALHENKCVYFSITEPIYDEKIQSSKVNCFLGIYNGAHRHHFLSSWGGNCKLDFNKPDAGNINLCNKP